MFENRYNLPLFDMILEDDNVGMYTISLVDDPAMEVSWYAFEKENDDSIKVELTQIVDDKQHKVMTVICRADFPVLRRNEEGKYYYIQFPKETIRLMSQRFLKNGYQGLVNLMHTKESFVEGIEMEQIFIKDVEAGIDPQQFKQIEDGSLFGIYKIENDEIWKDIMDGKYTAVSLEGLFRPVLHVDKERELNTLDELVDYIENK
jgi:hypothetical protein